jgi:hypothetical protein
LPPNRPSAAARAGRPLFPLVPVSSDREEEHVRNPRGRLAAVAMKRLVIALVALVAVGLIALVGWRIFEHFDQQDKIKNANKSCATFDVQNPSATLPAGFTLPAGQKLLDATKAGATTVVFASLPGVRADLVAIRDSVVRELAASGYQMTAHDQEPTFEADATITKAGVSDSINVRPLCSGRVVVRYTLH